MTCQTRRLTLGESKGSLPGNMASTLLRIIITGSTTKNILGRIWRHHFVAQQCRRQTSSTDYRKAPEASEMNSALAVGGDEAELLSKNAGKTVPYHYIKLLWWRSL